MIKIYRKRQPSSPGKLLSALLIASACVLLLPQAAQACGGLFSIDIPVNQESERIIFAVDDQGLTMYEQISYKGEAKDFAWVLPVPSVPTVDTAPTTLFPQLEEATQPRFYQGGPPTPCGLQLEDRRNFTGGSASPSSSGVEVLSGGTVGPYAYEVIGSEHPEALVEWLQQQKYRIPADLESQIEPYVQAKMLFLVMRLQPTAGVQDIVPMKVNVKTANPQVAVNLRIAASSARERMNLLVWIFGKQRYVPQNYASFDISGKELIGENGSINYLPLIDESVDEAGGQAFITEYAHPTESIDQLLQEEGQDLLKYPYVTRLFTRIKPQHMTLDPVFVPQSGLPDVNQYHSYQLPTNCDPFNLFLASLGLWGLPFVGGAILALVGGASSAVILWRRRKRKHWRKERGSSNPKG